MNQTQWEKRNGNGNVGFVRGVLLVFHYWNCDVCADGGCFSADRWAYRASDGGVWKELKNFRNHK